MDKSKSTRYVKRTQRDYTMTLKLQIVGEIERGELSLTGAKRKYGIQGRSTVLTWLRKYGSFDWENQTPTAMPKKSPEQKIMELEQKVKLLEKQKALLEKRADSLLPVQRSASVPTAVLIMSDIKLRQLLIVSVNRFLRLLNFMR